MENNSVDSVLKTIEIKDADVWGKITDCFHGGQNGKSRFFEKEILGGWVDFSDLWLNQPCGIRNGQEEKMLLSIFKGDGFQILNKPKPKIINKKERIGPCNLEQAIAFALLMDPEVSVVALIGPAGTGKTLMGLLAGYEQLENRYQKLLIYRSNYEIGNPNGFLPGDKEEKFEPWKKPIFDNLPLIIIGGNEGRKGGDYQRNRPSLSAISQFIERKMISIEPINYIQGRTLRDTFILVDEAENNTDKDTEMIIGRLGSNSKMVFVGDVSQIANSKARGKNNGLVHLRESLKGQKFFGFVDLLKNERSGDAEIALRLMSARRIALGT